MSGGLYVGFEAIGGNSFDYGTILRGLEDEMQKEAGIVQRMYESTTRTWKVRPSFFIKTVAVTRDENALWVYTYNNIYRFLDYGTAERWALMSSDFSPKTTHRVLGSRAGSGRAVKRGRSQMARPQPGIEAREFTTEIVARREKAMQKAIAKRLARAAKRVF